MALDKSGSSPWPSRVAGLLLLALVVQAGWVAGSLGMRLAAPEMSIAPVYAGEVDGESGLPALADISVAALNLFGNSSTVEVPLAISQNAPDTSLRLILNGVALGQRPEDSSAIVAGSSRSDVQRYRVGDVLPGNAHLVEVQQDRILLRRAGRIETLRFPVDSDVGAAVASEGPRRPLPQTTEEFVVEAQNRLSQDPVGSLATVGFSPRGENGGGYAYDGSNPMLNAMNLQTGDVVLAVNGHVLGDMETDRELIQQWLEQNELQIEVERGSSRFSVTVPVP